MKSYLEFAREKQPDRFPDLVNCPLGVLICGITQAKHFDKFVICLENTNLKIEHPADCLCQKVKGLKNA